MNKKYFAIFLSSLIIFISAPVLMSATDNTSLSSALRIGADGHTNFRGNDAFRFFVGPNDNGNLDADILASVAWFDFLSTGIRITRNNRATVSNIDGTFAYQGFDTTSNLVAKTGDVKGKTTSLVTETRIDLNAVELRFALANSDAVRWNAILTLFGTFRLDEFGITGYRKFSNRPTVTFSQEDRQFITWQPYALLRTEFLFFDTLGLSIDGYYSPTVEKRMNNSVFYSDNDPLIYSTTGNGSDMGADATLAVHTGIGEFRLDGSFSYSAGSLIYQHRFYTERSFFNLVWDQRLSDYVTLNLSAKLTWSLSFLETDLLVPGIFGGFEYFDNRETEQTAGAITDRSTFPKLVFGLTFSM